jgi:hypothetical protein
MLALLLLLIGQINCGEDIELSKEICYLIMSDNELNCTRKSDPEGYYIDLEDCIHHFTNIYKSVVMTKYTTIGNTSTCRLRHLMFDMNKNNCKVYGKTGGNKCTDNYLKIPTYDEEI